ncbi:MAG: methionyl-tRNA formyltransferase [Patescibacteria group bacterium]
MNLIYLASGTFGSLVLSHFKTKPNLVITQKDKVGGRGMKQLIPTAVKQYCVENKIPFVEIENKEDLRLWILDPHNSNVYHLTSCVFLVCDFGLIIQKELLDFAENRFINIHPSVLPLFRGPTPLQTALMNGETETAVTVIQIDEKVDHGPILAQEKIVIDITDDTPALMQKLAPLAARTIETLLLYGTGMPVPYKQDHTKATFTKKLAKEDSFVEIDTLVSYLHPLFKKFNLTHLLPLNPSSTSEWDVSPPLLGEDKVGYFQSRIYNLIRALQPWPTVWSTLPNKKVLKITKASFTNNELLITECSMEGKRYKI